MSKIDLRGLHNEYLECYDRLQNILAFKNLNRFALKDARVELAEYLKQEEANSNKLLDDETIVNIFVAKRLKRSMLENILLALIVGFIVFALVLTTALISDPHHEAAYVNLNYLVHFIFFSLFLSSIYFHHYKLNLTSFIVFALYIVINFVILKYVPHSFIKFPITIVILFIILAIIDPILFMYVSKNNYLKSKR